MFWRSGLFKLRAAGDLVQNLAQVVAQFRDFLITIARIFLQRLIQNLLQARRRRARSGFRQGFRLIVDDRMTDIHG